MRTHRLTTTFTLLATLSIGILVGSVMTRNVSGKEQSNVDTSDARPIVIPSPVTLSNGFSQIVKEVGPAVVNINTEEIPKQSMTRHRRGMQGQEGNDDDQQNQMQDFFNRFFGGQGGDDDQDGGNMGGTERRALGSGFIVDPRGYIITNNHVVDGADKIFVKLSTDPDGEDSAYQGRPAKVIGVDKDTDIAVIKIDTDKPLPTVKLGNSDGAQVGDWVLAIGSPFALSKTVTAGIISAKDRSIDEPGPNGISQSQFQRFIQTDAAINPGNSGGALVNSHGELVGINTFIISNSGSFAGAGFAIPSQIVRSTAEQLMKNGHVDHGYLGISLNDVTPANAHFFNLTTATGAIVSQVTPDSPASKGGLRRGDVISAINGQKIVNGSALQVAVSQITPGTNIALGIMRDGKPSTLNITVGRFQKNTDLADNNDDGSPKQGKLGLSVSDLTSDLRQQINAPDQLSGAVVQNVRPASPAEDAGLQPGDVILEVNRHTVTSASQFVNQVHQNPAGKDILLLVWSKGNSSYRTIHPESQNG